MQSYQDWLPNMFKAIHNTEHGQFLALPNKEGDNKEFVSDPCTTRSINAVRQETLQFPQVSVTCQALNVVLTNHFLF